MRRYIMCIQCKKILRIGNYVHTRDIFDFNHFEPNQALFVDSSIDDTHY